MVDDDDGDESPSPEPRTDSRSALPREITAWRRLRIIKRDETFSLIFFLRETEYIELELRSVEHQGAHETGARPGGGGAPPPSWTGCGPLGLDSFRQHFLYFPKVISVDFQVILRNFVFGTINNTMVVLLKTASLRVSFIQIMQIRVQNKGKSVWKSRYVGDVST